MTTEPIGEENKDGDRDIFPSEEVGRGIG